SEALDIEAVRAGLASSQPRENADALMALTSAGASGAPLRNELRDFLQHAPATSVATSAARAYAAVMSDEFADAADAMLRAPETPLHVRYEVAAELGRAGELERLQALIAVGGTTSAAARRAIVVSRVHPQRVRDQLFAPGRMCADAAAEDLCLELARDMLLYDLDSVDASASPLNALLVAERAAIASGDLSAWTAAVPDVLEVSKDAVLSSVRTLAAAGLSPRDASVLLPLVNDPDVHQTNRMLAGLLVAQSLSRDELEAPVPSDALARAAIAAATYTGTGRMTENDQAALEQLGADNANPFGALSLLMLARQGEPGVAENAASSSFPSGFVDLVRAQATPDLEAALGLVLLSATDDDLATDALSVLAIGRREPVLEILQQSDTGSAERRARFLARLGSEDDASAASLAAALTDAPHLESVRWFVSRNVAEPLQPLFEASAQDGTQAARRHAVIAQIAGAVQLSAEQLDNIIVRPTRQQVVESRDLRSLALRARFGQDAPSLAEAISLADALGDARAGRFEVSVALQRALDAHCAD
ncbi:MAG: hypothetical protein ACI81R_002856, partial [Bradymonadia bacterium]